MPNFSSLAGLEVAEKFLWGVGWGVGWGGLHSHFHVKPNRCVVLCWGWGFDNKTKFIPWGPAHVCNVVKYWESHAHYLSSSLRGAFVKSNLNYQQFSADYNKTQIAL